MNEVLATINKLELVSGNLKQIYRGLMGLSDEPIVKLLKTISPVFKSLNTFGNNLAKQAGQRWHVIADSKLQMAADYLASHVEDSGGDNPRAKQRNDPARQKMKIMCAHRLIDGVKRTALEAQKVFISSSKDGDNPELTKLKTVLQSEWNGGIRQLMYNMVVAADTVNKQLGRSLDVKSESNGRTNRRSLTIEDKLSGRLATADIVGTHNRDISRTELTRQYGQRLANLVESGNKKAIKLVELINSRRSYGVNGGISPTILESIETPINDLSKELGMPISEDGIDILSLLKLANSPNSFSSMKQFRSNLTEGLILNVTKLASNCLSIPSGQYLVWATNAKNTMLVPTTEAKDTDVGISANRPERYDVMTPELVNCWNKVERSIWEDSHDRSPRNYENPASGAERVGRPALKKKVEAAGGVRAAAEVTGLSPGDISKHSNNKEFEISGSSARAYIDGIGADPDDLYKYGRIKVFDRGTEEEEEEDNKEKRRRQEVDEGRDQIFDSLSEIVDRYFK
jgi:hypothetical protein